MFKKTIFKTIFKYAIPNVISMWIFTLYTMIDGVFISRFVGSTALPSLSVQKLKYKCKVPLIQNFTLLFYLFFLLCTNLYHNNLILLILLFLFSILFLVIYLTLSFLHFLVIYNIHLLSWLLLRYS